MLTGKQGYDFLMEDLLELGAALPLSNGDAEHVRRGTGEGGRFNFVLFRKINTDKYSIILHNK